MLVWCRWFSVCHVNFFAHLMWRLVTSLRSSFQSLWNCCNGMRIIMKLGEEASNHAISRPSWFLKGGNQIIYWWEDRNLNVTACCRFVELAVDLSSSTPSLSAEAQKKSPIVDNLNGAALSLLHPAPSNLVDVVLPFLPGFDPWLVSFIRMWLRLNFLASTFIRIFRVGSGFLPKIGPFLSA